MTESVPGYNPGEEKFEDEEGEQSYLPEDLRADRGVVTTPYDAPVRSLLDQIQEKSLIVNPPFQRRSVWNRERQSRLIESLLLNIPIPVLYFAEDDDGTHVVVDGQQRLRSVEEFYSGVYKLQGLQVLSELNGKRWSDLTQKQSRTIRSRTLRCVVISSNSPPNLRFEMFERLNTGGVPLNDQELRNCVYQGSLNDFINDLVTSRQWLEVIRRPVPDNRMRHHELALRFFALDDILTNYRPPLKRVLNDFMRRNREVDAKQKEFRAHLFEKALINVKVVFGPHPFRRIRWNDTHETVWDTSLNRAVFDIQMLAFARLSPEEVEDRREAILNRFVMLCLENSDFADAVSRATADRTRFYTRMRIWGENLAAEGIAPAYLAHLPQT